MGLSDVPNDAQNFADAAKDTTVLATQSVPLNLGTQDSEHERPLTGTASSDSNFLAVPSISIPLHQRSDSQDSHHDNIFTPSPSVARRSSCSSRPPLEWLEQVQNKCLTVRQTYASLAVIREGVKAGFLRHAVWRLSMNPTTSNAGGDWIKVDAPLVQYVPYDWMEGAIQEVDGGSQALLRSIDDLLQIVSELSDATAPHSPLAANIREWLELDDPRPEGVPGELVEESPVPAGVRVSDDIGAIVTALDEMSIQAPTTPALESLDVSAEEGHALITDMSELLSARQAVQDLLIASFQSEADERVSRELRRDQGQKLDETDKAFRKRFKRARVPLSQQMNHLIQQISEVETRCREQGLDVSMFNQQPHVDDVLLDDTVETRSRASSLSGRQDVRVFGKVEAWQEGLATSP